MTTTTMTSDDELRYNYTRRTPEYRLHYNTLAIFSRRGRHPEDTKFFVLTDKEKILIPLQPITLLPLRIRCYYDPYNHLTWSICPVTQTPERIFEFSSLTPNELYKALITNKLMLGHFHSPQELKINHDPHYLQLTRDFC